MATKKVKKKEEQLGPFSTTENHTSDEPLLLDADATASSLKELSSMVGALSWLHELIGKGQATVSTRHNALGIARSNLRQLDKLLGSADDLKQEDDLRLQMLRQANMEVHRLNEELGKGVTVAAIGNKLYLLDRTIYNWWQNLGFTYSKATIQAHSRGAAFHVEFSVGVERHISSMEEKPVSAKAKLDAKRANLGKQLDIAYDGSEPYVVDNQENRTWITNTLRARFPTSRIWKWESLSVSKLDIFQIRHVEVNIDITDVGDTVEERDV